MNEREQFEAWAVESGAGYRTEKHGLMFYDAGEKHAAWKAWQARAARSVPSEAGELVERLRRVSDQFTCHPASRGIADCEEAGELMRAAAAALAASPVPADAEPVAKVVSWTNGSYWRNYKLEWFKDVPEGTHLFAAPSPTMLNGLTESAASVSAPAQQAGAVVYPEDGTRSPFTVINLGHGKVQMGDCIHDQRLHALWFGRDGKGMGHEEELNREARDGETLAVITFANVEGLDVLLDAVLRMRRIAFPDAPATAPSVEAQDDAPIYRGTCPSGDRCIHGCHSNEACYDKARAVEAQAVSTSDLLEILEPLSKVYPIGSIGREKVERVIAALKESQR